MDTPRPDPPKLLGIWMEWERGDAAPGRTLADLKRSGMRELLDELALASLEAADVDGGHA